MSETEIGSVTTWNYTPPPPPPADVEGLTDRYGRSWLRCDPDGNGWRQAGVPGLINWPALLTQAPLSVFVVTDDTPQAYFQPPPRADITDAEERGYRRAVQALRDEAARQDAAGNDRLRIALVYAVQVLEPPAAAPRNEGAQT